MSDIENDKLVIADDAEVSVETHADAPADNGGKKGKKKKEKPAGKSKVKWNASTSGLDFQEDQKSGDDVSEDVSELASFAAKAAADFGIFSDEPANEPVATASPATEGDGEPVVDTLEAMESGADGEGDLAAALSEQTEELEEEADQEMLEAASDAEALMNEDAEELVEEEVLAVAGEGEELEMALAGEDSEEAVEAAAQDAAADGVQMSAEERALMESELGPEQVEFVEADRMMSIIESMLFSTDKPVSVATLKVIFKGTNIRTKDITRALDDLAREYAGARRGVTIEEINGGYQLRTKSDNAEYLRRLAKVRPFKLSGPALESMAIIAYKQPITKHEIDEIRGVESGHLLRALMERGLIAFGERSELPGKPMTYVSTRKFLETFGLRNIRELPSLSEIDALLPEGIGEPEEEKETLSDLTERMSTELTSSYSEGEDELLKINEQLQAVDTTSEFFEQEKVRERERRDRERAQDIRERLVLGDQVEEKDRRWLDRYEAKLHEAQNPAAVAEGAEAVEAPPAIGGELEALSDEAARAAETRAASDDEEDALTESEALLLADDSEIDDLSARTDWDDHEHEV